MDDIPEAEARALLASRFICPDPSDWAQQRIQPGTHFTECGLVNEQGARTGLHVQLIARTGRKTGITTFKFTVFRLNLRAPQRVYQLHVQQAPRAPADRHNWPHEHWGDHRETGDAAWLNWGYAAAIDHFCRQTNIEFQPPLRDPEHFELRP